jgi:SAM-dependent methyltransferase
MKAAQSAELYKPGYREQVGKQSSIWEQVWNVDMHAEGGVSKNHFVLDRIASTRGAALEIGCSPGRLLYWLTWAARFERVVGIDPDDPAAIRSIGCFQGELLTGLFPAAAWTLAEKSFDLIVGLDVFEHSHEPEAFLSECFRLLRPNGQLMLMLPLADGLETNSPFFNPVEHAYIHSRRNMDSMLNDAGLSSGVHSRWARGHEFVSSMKMA